MKEKAAAAAPISPLKHPMKAPLPPPSPSTKKSSDNTVEGLGFGAQKIDLAGLAALRARYAGEEYESNTGTPARSSFDGKLQKEQSTRKTTKTGVIPSSPSISMFGKLMQRSQSAIATKSSSHPEAANGSDSAASPRKKKSMTSSSSGKSVNIDVQRSSQSFLQRVRGSLFSSRRVRNLTGATNDGQSEFDDRNIKT